MTFCTKHFLLYRIFCYNFKSLALVNAGADLIIKLPVNTVSIFGKSSSDQEKHIIGNVLAVRQCKNAIVAALHLLTEEYGYVALKAVNKQGTPKNDFWMYDPASNTWTNKADVGGGVRWFATGFAIGGKGYIGIGTGNTAADLKNDFWEYTPE
jgi:hypothetical protein